MEKSKPAYWAIFNGKEIVFEGSFSACWQAFIRMYSHRTLREIAHENIRIGRKT